MVYFDVRKFRVQKISRIIPFAKFRVFSWNLNSRIKKINSFGGNKFSWNWIFPLNNTGEMSQWAKKPVISKRTKKIWKEEGSFAGERLFLCLYCKYYMFVCLSWIKLQRKKKSFAKFAKFSDIKVYRTQEGALNLPTDGVVPLRFEK